MTNERYKPWCTKGTVKHDKKNMVWGCFCSRGVGQMHLIEGIMRKEQYKTILETEALPSAQRLFRRKNWTFQQDNDIKHTANAIKKRFTTNNISILDWPSQSPDFNPIENSVKSRKPRTEKEQYY